MPIQEINPKSEAGQVIAENKLIIQINDLVLDHNKIAVR